MERLENVQFGEERGAPSKVASKQGAHKAFVIVNAKKKYLSLN